MVDYEEILLSFTNSHISEDFGKYLEAVELPQSENKIVDEPPKTDAAPENKENGFSLMIMKLIEKPIQAWQQIVRFSEYLSDSTKIVERK